MTRRSHLQQGGGGGDAEAGGQREEALPGDALRAGGAEGEEVCEGEEAYEGEGGSEETAPGGPPVVGGAEGEPREAEASHRCERAEAEHIHCLRLIPLLCSLFVGNPL